MRLVAVTVVLLALAGCGGGGDRLSRAEFVEQATAICDSVDERIAAVGEPQSLEEIETLGREVREILDDGLGDLRALRPPEDLEASFDRYLERGDDTLDQLDRLVAGAEAGDRAAVERAGAEVEEIAADAERLATAAGIPACEDE
jgi:hypothetical protein